MISRLGQGKTDFNASYENHLVVAIYQVGRGLTSPDDMLVT
jgi:hypothetical protein